MEKSKHDKLSSRWATFVAPMIVEVIPGCVAAQFNATCAGVLFSCCATEIKASRTGALRSVNLLKTGFGESFIVWRRPSPRHVPPSRLYFPLRKPLASGLQGQ